MKRYTWFEAVGVFIIVDTEEGKVIGSVIPQVNGDIIIRYGFDSGKKPMTQEVISYQGSDRKTLLKASGVIAAHLVIGSEEDDRVVIKAIAQLDEDDSIRKEGETQ